MRIRFKGGIGNSGDILTKSNTQTTSLSEPAAAFVEAEASSTENILGETSDAQLISVTPSEGTSHGTTAHASTVIQSDAKLSRSSQNSLNVIKKPTSAPQIPGSETKSQAKKGGSMLGKINNLLTTDMQAITDAQEVLALRKSHFKSLSWSPER